MIFLAMMRLVLHTGPEVIANFGKILLGTALSMPLTLMVCASVLALYGRVNPRHFLRKIVPFLPVPLALSSSNAALSQTLSLAKNLGVAPELSSFSVPVGIQIHQTGSCCPRRPACGTKMNILV